MRSGRPHTRPAVASAAVPAAFLLANAASYALLLVAAHVMSASDYGALSSLLGLLLISTIPMLALQTVAARRAATDAGTGGLVRGGTEIGVAAMLLLGALSPALAVFLHLDDVFGIVLVAASVPANAALGAAMGVAQGQRRFLRLALLILAATGGRSVGGLVGLLVGDSPDSTLLGVFVGTAAAAIVVALAQPGGSVRAGLSDRDRGGVVSETLHAGHAHGTFLLLTGLDVLLARHVLSAGDAGVYSVGSVVTRAAVWLPQSVALLLFASLADQRRHRAAARRAVSAVMVLGAVSVVVTGVAGALVVTVVGGTKYHRLDGTIWLFALLGSLLALVQLAVLAGLAQRNPRRAGLLWATILIDVVVVLSTSDHATPARLVVTLASVAGASAAVAVWLLVGRSAQFPVPAGHGPGVNVASRPGPNAGATPEGTG